MYVTRRIFVSMPADAWLTGAQNEMKWAIVERIERLGYVPEIFTDPTGRRSLAAAKTWSPGDADEIIRRCYGAAIIGLPRWEFGTPQGAVKLPTEYSHYEGAVARTLGLPLLIVAQKDLMRRVVFDGQFGVFIGTFPEGADRSWLAKKEFEVCFDYWRAALDNRRDVFLGYCGAASATAHRLRALLEGMGATVLDWQSDFKPGRSILEEIEEARTRCTGGIFLFTADDRLQKPGPGRKAAPRDNVVFEAGYFAAAKSKKRVLIIRESGTKLPADLGGDIYVELQSRTDLSSIEDQVKRFLDTF